MRRKTGAGYTLTEVLIVVAILGVLSSVSALLFVQLSNFHLNTTARNEVERDARQALDAIDRQLRQAVSTSIVVDTPPGQGYFSRVTFHTIDGRGMKFYQRGNQLVQAVGANESVISRNLYYLAFCFPDTNNPTIINVSLAMAKNVQLGQKKVLQMSIQKVRIMN